MHREINNFFFTSIILINCPDVKYGATRVEVDVDGSLSYPEPQIIAKDKGKCLFQELNSLLTSSVEVFALIINWLGLRLFCWS